MRLWNSKLVSRALPPGEGEQGTHPALVLQTGYQNCPNQTEVDNHPRGAGRETQSFPAQC